MTTKAQPTYTARIADHQAKIAEAATAHGRAIAEHETAIANQAEAIRDDGKIDPAILFERAEKARRDVGVSEIKKERAAQSLADLELAFRQDLESMAGTMIRDLNDAANDAEAKAIEQLRAFCLPSLAHDSALVACAMCFVGVADRRHAEHQVRNYWPDLREGITSNLAPAILSAAEVL